MSSRQRPQPQPLPRYAVPGRPMVAPVPRPVRTQRATLQARRRLSATATRVIKNVALVLMAMIICGLLANAGRQVVEVAKLKAQVAVTQQAGGHCTR